MLFIYVLHPGKIRLKNGSIEHFTADELAELYKVDLSQCLIYQPTKQFKDTVGIRYMHLRPRGDENYSLPKFQEESV